MKPVIGISSCARYIDDDSDIHHVVFRSYVDYVQGALDAIPFIIPACFGSDDTDELRTLIGRMDGLLLSGSPSNVGLRRRGDVFSIIEVVGMSDPRRDATTMHLLRAAMDENLPILGICRGCQEINVAQGGNLLADVQNQKGRFDHRARPGASLPERYAPVHRLQLLPGSRLAELQNQLTTSAEILVNSLHSQCVSELGDGVVVEALASDGTVEAIRVPGSDFVMGVQWHLEWGRTELDTIITAEFRKSCLHHMGRKTNHYGN